MPDDTRRNEKGFSGYRTSWLVRSLFVACGAFFFSVASFAQDVGTLDPKPLPPLAHPDDPSTPAKELFGRQTAPADIASRSIGFYARGCLAGGEALPVNGEAWQVMRLSRNRMWGNPELIEFLEHFAKRVPKVSHWPGILVGDMSQPRGGPMITGHASHQIGLDADIWLTPMPSHELSRAAREEMSATNLVREDGLDVDPHRYTLDHLKVIRAAAEEPQVQRIFVNAAIKKALCRDAGEDRGWLNKVRPMWGHNYHFHVRLGCTADAGNCTPQDPVPPGDGCNQLAWWFRPSVLHPVPGKPRAPMTMAALPVECKAVLKAN